MQVFIKTVSGKAITIEIESSDTIRNLKKQIEAKEGVCPDQQIIVYSGQQLEDYKTLADYSIEKEATVRFFSKILGGMQIYVRSLTGRLLTLQVEPNALVRTVKSAIEAQEGIPADDQRLIWGGKDLEDGRTLAEYNILREANLVVILRIRGGMMNKNSVSKYNMGRKESSVTRSWKELLQRFQGYEPFGITLVRPQRGEKPVRWIITAC